MFELLTLELGQSIGFALMLNVAHNGIRLSRLGPSKIETLTLALNVVLIR